MGEAKEAGVATVVFWMIRAAIKGVLWALVIAVPVTGVWAASSLAVYWDGPKWAAYLAGLAAFPLLPLAWETFATWRRGRKETPAKRTLTYGDRLILRTFVVSFFFFGGFLWLWPVPIFEALVTRGDWMLEGRDDERSASIREALHSTTGRRAPRLAAARHPAPAGVGDHRGRRGFHRERRALLRGAGA